MRRIVNWMVHETPCTNTKPTMFATNTFEQYSFTINTHATTVKHSNPQHSHTQLIAATSLNTHT